MNNLQLKALRQGLGLTVANAAELCSVSKRSFQRWELGNVPVPNEVDSKFFLMASHYAMILNQMLADVEKATVRPADDEIKPTIKPVLPFFHTFESFQMATECPHVAYWRIYQSVISQLLITGKITKLDDSAEIPKSWGIWKWLRDAYEPT